MYKTIRHGENSLQYTILPQNDDYSKGGSSGGNGGGVSGLSASDNIRSSAGSGVRLKSGSRNKKRSLMAYIGLFFVCSIITGAILVPLMVSVEVMTSPKDWFYKQAASLTSNFNKKPIVIEVGGNNDGNSNSTSKVNTTNHKLIIDVGPSQQSPPSSPPQTSLSSSIPTITSSSFIKMSNSDSTLSSISLSSPQPQPQPSVVQLDHVVAEDDDDNGGGGGGGGGVSALGGGEFRNDEYNNNDLSNSGSNNIIRKPNRLRKINKNNRSQLSPITTTTYTTMKTTTTTTNIPTIAPTIHTVTGNDVNNNNNNNDENDIDDEDDDEANDDIDNNKSNVPINKATDYSRSTSSKIIGKLINVKNNSTYKNKSIKSEKSAVIIATTATVLTTLTNLLTTPLPPPTPVPSSSSSLSSLSIPEKHQPTWIKSHWPIVDPSTYFQWTAYESEDNLLLPVMFCSAIMAVIVFVLLCVILRYKKCFSCSRKRNEFLTVEAQHGDNTTLLTNDEQQSDDE